MIYDVFRSPVIIDTFLTFCYGDSKAANGVREGIVKSSNNPFGHGAFASIMWSRGMDVEGGWEGALGHARNRSFEGGGGGIDVMLVYGREDKWIKPEMGRRVYERLGDEGGEKSMWEVEGGGHCVMHEYGELVGIIVGGVGGEKRVRGRKEEWGGVGVAERIF
ncbi:hypothetical protein TrCOL_g787 [Triparma columacea]|uniref:Alpha/beta-hydrolase n=1 Tax=Triparma columacea TaxID=722753 RepID=A0A9W7G541_9STRA|nr:hypothetical protein TrCOL_g787 [Triparma columacea]